MLSNASWIIHPENKLYEPITFIKDFNVNKNIINAKLYVTSLGCYYAELNGKRIGDFILAPGFTSRKRVQCQEYDITDGLKAQNRIEITVSEGWYKGKINFGVDKDGPEKKKSLIAMIKIDYEDGSTTDFVTDESWYAKRSKLRFAELYDGERYDCLFKDEAVSAQVYYPDAPMIVKQQGVYVKEQERIRPKRIFKAPNGDTLIDFGQNLTGYFEFSANAKNGDRVEITVGEELDKHGNFYNANYRDAAAKFEYICKDGYNKYKPILAFWGFRYMRVDSFPEEITENCIEAIVLHSDIRRTGYLRSSNPMLNSLFSNIIWGQKGNFLDIPTDCPQRDERQGWTGDATVFCKAASYNFDVEQFFDKWLTDLTLDQGKTGYIPNIVPQTVCWDWSTAEYCGAVWGDSCTIIPYQMYLTYGNKEILKKQLPTMIRYLDYIKSVSKDENLWTGCEQFGDWLGLDSPQGSYRGSSNDDFIASVFYANSVLIVAKSSEILGIDANEYYNLYDRIVKKIRSTFKEYKTQTECAISLYFNITEDKAGVAKQLADMIIANGKKLKTGFVGTPYLLHALSQNGYSELAYDLLLQDEFPSWLFSVKCGATTIWEHWDGKNEKGEFWSERMNSFNHYAYGSVADWVYEVACGIKLSEHAPGFKEVTVAPVPTKKLDFLEAEFDTRNGKIISKWYNNGDKTSYEITVPTNATIIIDGIKHNVTKGTYKY